MDKEKEIDLGFIMLKTYNLLKRHLVLIVISVILCTAISLAHFYSKVPIYESSMLVSTGIIKPFVTSILVEDLQGLISEQNHTSVSKKLNLSKNVAALKLIEVEDMEEKVADGKVDVVKVIVRTTETTILKDLQKGIIKYLEDNPYIKKEIALERQRLNEGIDFLSKELNEISKLKANISAIGEKGNTNGTSFDLEDIYRQSMELFERKLQLTHDLKTIENFEVIQGFTAYQKPVSPKLSLSLAGGVVAGLILAFLIIFFKEFRKHLKTIEEQAE